MKNTKIEWCDHTWNPITGCTPVSDGCKNCYAKRMAKRLAGRGGYRKIDPFRPRTIHPDKWEEPLKIKKPSMIFVCSMGDLFHEVVSDGNIARVFSIIHQCPQHIFLILTKRPERMHNFLTRSMWWINDTPEHVWLGVTAENQKAADERIPILLDIPAAVRFVSVEPMLGPVDIGRWRYPMHWHWNGKYKSPQEALKAGAYAEKKRQALVLANSRFIDWIICGGETGPGARPMHPYWVRSLRDQCIESCIQFFFKGWGEWLPIGQFSNNYPCDPDNSIKFYDMEGTGTAPLHWNFNKSGKKRSGYILDEHIYDQIPEVTSLRS